MQTFSRAGVVLRNHMFVVILLVVVATLMAASPCVSAEGFTVLTYNEERDSLYKSADGSMWAFETDQSLIAADTNAHFDVYLKDFNTNQFYHVALTQGQVPAAGTALSIPSIFRPTTFATNPVSADGRYVYFFLPVFNQDAPYLCRYDRQTQEPEVVSVETINGQDYSEAIALNPDGYEITVSTDGRFVLFPVDTDGMGNIRWILRDMITKTNKSMDWGSTEVKLKLSGDGNKIFVRMKENNSFSPLFYLNASDFSDSATSVTPLTVNGIVDGSNTSLNTTSYLAYDRLYLNKSATRMVATYDASSINVSAKGKFLVYVDLVTGNANFITPTSFGGITTAAIDASGNIGVNPFCMSDDGNYLVFTHRDTTFPYRTKGYLVNTATGQIQLMPMNSAEIGQGEITISSDGQKIFLDGTTVLNPFYSSGSSGFLSFTPAPVSFGTAYPGEVLSRLVTVANSSTTAVTLGTLSFGNAYVHDFTLGDGCSGLTLAANGTCSVTVNFMPLSCGSKGSTLLVPSDKGDSSVTLLGSACGSGTASLKGNVLDATTWLPLANATVALGTLPTVPTDANGNYQINALAAGSYDLVISKAGYSPWRSSVNLAPQQSAVKNAHIFPANWTGVRITSINSPYSTGKPYYFLPDLSSFTTVDFTAYVDWGGKVPGKVRFISPGGTFEVPTNTAIASKSFNIATMFTPCSTLKAVAIAADGTESPEASADFLVTKPLGATPLSFVSDLNGFSYKTAVPVKAEFLKSLEKVVDKSVPVFGDNPFRVNYIPELDVSFKSDGTGSYKYSWKNMAMGKSLEKDYYQHRDYRKFKTNYKYLELLKAESEIYKTLGIGIPLPSVNVGGREMTFFPLVDIGVEFNPNSCSNNEAGWKYKGSAGFAGDFKYEAVRQNVTPLGPIPVPWYLKFTLSLGGDFTISVNDLFDKKFTGAMNLNPSVAGSLGVGVHEMGAAEGTLTMGAETKWMWPSVNPMHLEEMAIFLEEKARLYIGPWEWNTNSYKQTWCLAGPCAQQAPSLSERMSSEPVLVARDYLTAGTATFEREPNLATRQFVTASQTYNVSTASLASATFPVSNPSLSAAGSSSNLLWISDNASRSPVNRTMLVHSNYNGSTWSQPVPVADDGTSDTSPAALTFSDGTIAAVWENLLSPLGDTATFPEMLSKMEISVAVFNPVTSSWNPAVRLSSNSVLDRSPKLAGTVKNNLLLTWISNDQDDLSGSAAKPNKLWYARFNGAAWSLPAVAATVPYGINRYTVAYDGSAANIVLSMDTDGNVATITDLELYRLNYAGGSWGALSRLTSDTVIDSNPQLALDSNGAFILTWVKGGELSSVTGFDFGQRTVIRGEEEYSSTLADFKQATAADGKIAVIYADTSDAGSSDLFAAVYDPDFKLWGNPMQLTADAHTEQRPALAFLGSDSILACYNRKLLINADGSLATGTYTELAMLKHTLGDDLALKVGSFDIDPANAAPGSAVTLSVVAQNVGDKVAQNVAVMFYNGDPAAGGVAIDGATVVGPFRPGEEQVVSIPWTIPQGSAPLIVYAVIDPAGVIDTVNRSNNKISLFVAAPDLSIRDLSWEKIGPARFRLVANVFNNGGTSSTASTLALRSDSATGSVLVSLPVKALERFESQDLSYDWNASAVGKPYYTVIATVDETDVIVEGDENNNSYQVSLPGSQQDIQAFPPEIAFGAVLVGQKSTQELLVRNAGTASLIVSSVSVGAPYAIAPGGSNPCSGLSPTLLPGVSCSLEVSITPETSGNWSASVAISSNDPDASTMTLPVNASVPVTMSRLNVTLSGTVRGNVTSNPAGIACTEGTCTSEFRQGSTVTLLPTPSVGSAFSGWSGVCSGAGNCSVLMSADKSAVASFLAKNPLVKRDGASPAFFSTLSAAVSAAGGAETVTLLAQEGDFTENLVLANAVERTLRGGYDNTFSGSGAYSRLLGNLTIAAGALTVDRLIIGGASDSVEEETPPVIMLVELPSTYYSTFELAYDAAMASGLDLRPVLIRAGVGTISGNLNLNRNLALTLLGGLDSTLTRADGYLHIKGSLVITAGSLVADRIVIE